MTSEIKVPTLPESVSEATILEWHKQAGDFVNRGETLVDLETEKVVLEIPAPDDGVLVRISHAGGDTVVEGDLLAVLEDGEKPTKSAADIKAAQDSGAVQSEEDDRHGPAVRALLAEHNLQAAAVSASGRGGRITKEDVIKHLASAKQTPEAITPAPVKPPVENAEPVDSLPTLPGARERKQWREPMSRIRQTIATRLVQAQQTAAMLTTFNEVDMTAVMNLRARYKQEFEEKHGTRLGFMSFFVRAAAEAIQKYPMINAFIDGTDLVKHNYADIGIAVSSPRGLLVPVLRDTELKSFARIEAEIRDFGARAKKATIKMDELTGGTFTITNGGVFGSLVSTPILNPPQSAILGMHKIQERPVAESGQVVVRPMMYLALSYDHRIVDGSEAVQFLVSIKSAIEDPTRLLLEL